MRPSSCGLANAWRAAMKYYVGLDVSLKQTSICVVKQTGSVVREVVVDADPDHCALLQSDDRRPNAFQAIEKCRCLYWIDEPTPCVWRGGLVRPDLEVWRRHAAQLSFRSGRGTADPRAEMVGAESLGDEACQAQWA